MHFYFSDEIIDSTTILPRKLVFGPVSAYFISEVPIETHGIKNLRASKHKMPGKIFFIPVLLARFQLATPICGFSTIGGCGLGVDVVTMSLCTFGHIPTSWFRR